MRSVNAKADSFISCSEFPIKREGKGRGKGKIKENEKKKKPNHVNGDLSEFGISHFNMQSNMHIFFPLSGCQVTETPRHFLGDYFHNLFGISISQELGRS